MLQRSLETKIRNLLGGRVNLAVVISMDFLPKVYQNHQLVRLEGLPMPRRDLLPPDNYVTINTVQTAKGCPHNCSFCSVTRFNGRSYRFRPIDEVIREIETLPSHNVFIIHDNIYNHRERTRKLLEAMVPLRIRWGSQCTISIVHDPEMLELAAGSGCVELAVGFESFCKESLQGALKGFNNLDRFHRDIEIIKHYGILIWGSFVLGFDEDDEESLEKSVEMARRSKLDFACFNFLTPLPRTMVYDQFEKEGRLTSKNWAHYNMANLVFRPARVTTEVLEKMVKKAWLEFYSTKSVVHWLGLPLKKDRLFIWLLNLVLCFYTRKKLKWNRASSRVKV